jgi:hypothetical protein
MMLLLLLSLPSIYTIFLFFVAILLAYNLLPIFLYFRFVSVEICPLCYPTRLALIAHFKISGFKAS